MDHSSFMSWHGADAIHADAGSRPLVATLLVAVLTMAAILGVDRLWPAAFDVPLLALRQAGLF